MLRLDQLASISKLRRGVSVCLPACLSICPSARSTPLQGPWGLKKNSFWALGVFKTMDFGTIKYQNNYSRNRHV